MTAFVFYVLVFLAVGVFFLFFHLILGRLVRPVRPEPEKLTIYECGEPTIGSAWIQFDLRYYVVALLFVIFDVEVAFFFPWATTFGKANTLSKESITLEQRAAITEQLTPDGLPPLADGGGAGRFTDPQLSEKDRRKLAEDQRQAAGTFARLAMIDIAIFFGVLLVGFAYLWRRGDIDWVRSTAAERLAARGIPPQPTRPPAPSELVGAGR
jgi:NADH-quinone oxidoreductase subunit A